MSRKRRRRGEEFEDITPLEAIELEGEEEGLVARREKGKERAGTSAATPRKKRKRTKRPPSIKARLQKKLRARRTKLKQELRAVERDLNSLTCRRKKKAEDV